MALEATRRNLLTVTPKKNHFGWNFLVFGLLSHFNPSQPEVVPLVLWQEVIRAFGKSFRFLNLEKFHFSVFFLWPGFKKII